MRIRKSQGDGAPESLRRCSMRPSRFSKPSIYLALRIGQQLDDSASIRRGPDIPLGRTALLLNLGEDTFGLVVCAVTASRQLAVALDLLLPAHITSLWVTRRISTTARRSRLRRKYCERQLTRAILLRLASTESSSNMAESWNIWAARSDVM